MVEKIEPANADLVPSGARIATLNRETGETQIALTVNLDGRVITMWIPAMVSWTTWSARSPATASSTLPSTPKAMSTWAGTIWLRMWGFCWAAFNQALGEVRGIRRMGHAIVPLDETLVMVALDLSGRSYAVVETTLDETMVETLSGDWYATFSSHSPWRAGSTCTPGS